MNKHLLNHQMLRQAYLIPLWRQNMNRHLLKQRRWLLAVLLVSLALTLVLSACNQDSGGGSGSSTGTTKQPVATVARIQLGITARFRGQISRHQYHRLHDLRPGIARQQHAVGP